MYISAFWCDPSCDYDHENDDCEHDYHVPTDVSDVDGHHRVCQTRMTLTPMLMTVMAMRMMLIIVDVC